MDNPYTPPHAAVSDIAPTPKPGWVRLIVAVIISSALALPLAWFVAPPIAQAIGRAQGPATEQEAMTRFLLGDMGISFCIFFLCSLLATHMARSRPFIAALGVSVVGWLVYFVEVGGVTGMLQSVYPLWYEFTPTHFGSGLIAGALASRARKS